MTNFTRLVRHNAVLGLACAITIVFAAGVTGWTLTRPWPIHRWESAIVSECQRVAVGLPVYESADTSGHATHMYGPLTHLVVGAVFRVTGPSWYPGRLLGLGSLIASAIIFFIAVRPRGVLLSAFVAAAVLAAFGQAATGFVEIRPDSVSLLLGMVAICLWYKAHLNGRGMLLAAGTIVSVLAFLFKQPAAMVAAIPVVATLISRKPLFKARTLSFLAAPFVAILTAIAVIRVAGPQTFHYMFTVPSRYQIIPENGLWWLGWLAAMTSCVWVALIVYLREGHRISLSDPKTAWILAAIFVTVPCSVLTAAKVGGMSNSLLPAYFALLAFFLHISKPLEALFREATNRPRVVQFVFSACVVVPLYLVTIQSPNDTFGDAGFLEIVRAAESLEGELVCPQDPAAAVFSGGRPGRSVILEYDAAGWPTRMPPTFFGELTTADFAVTLGGWRAWPLSQADVERVLRSKGFIPMDLPQLHASTYKLWQRVPSNTP